MPRRSFALQSTKAAICIWRVIGHEFLVGLVGKIVDPLLRAGNTKCQIFQPRRSSLRCRFGAAANCAGCSISSKIWYGASAMDAASCCWLERLFRRRLSSRQQ